MKNNKIKKIISAILLLIIALAYPAYSKLTNSANENPAYTENVVTDFSAEESQSETSQFYTERYKPTQEYTEATTKQSTTKKSDSDISESGSYFSKDDVALYIHTYGHLPDNFITKKEAQKLGWTGGSVEKVAPGKAIGGDYFGNYEKQLPQAKGIKYTECDIDTNGRSSRGAKRIIFSNKGDIYYTGDHYETFTKLY